MAILGNATLGKGESYSGGTQGSQNTSIGYGGTYGTGANATAESWAMMRYANDYNSLEAEKNREFQAEQARLNRKWQEKMSNTAYQRAVADLQKAGINPILAYSSGASTPSGSSASGSSASSAMGSAYTDNYTYSSGQGTSWGENWSKSRNMTKSDLANQISAITGLLAGTITEIVDGIRGGNSGKEAKTIGNMTWYDGKEYHSVPNIKGYK